MFSGNATIIDITTKLIMTFEEFQKTPYYAKKSKIYSEDFQGQELENFMKQYFIIAKRHGKV